MCFFVCFLLSRAKQIKDGSTTFFANRQVNNKKMWQIIFSYFSLSSQPAHFVCLLFARAIYSFCFFFFHHSSSLVLRSGSNTCVSTIWNRWSNAINSSVKFSKSNLLHCVTMFNVKGMRLYSTIDFSVPCQAYRHTLQKQWISWKQAKC